jgi:rod shape-determining protein MreD
MNWLNPVALLAAAFLAVFGEAAWAGTRPWLGAQIDLLPALVVYASLNCGVTTLALLAVWGGLWFDSLSANPLGVSILPLFLTGWLLQSSRDLVLRDQRYAQFVLGLLASAAVPLMTLLLLLTMGEQPLVGWTSCWQWLVMAVGGAVFTPAIFLLLGRLHRAFDYPVARQTSFRPDREIKRGRSL